MTSTPSMPAIESSSGLVTCDSITSDEAPDQRRADRDHRLVDRGYSRTDSRVNDTSADQHAAAATSRSRTPAGGSRFRTAASQLFGRLRRAGRAGTPPAATATPAAAAARAGARRAAGARAAVDDRITPQRHAVAAHQAAPGPAVTTTSPGCRPSRISTLPGTAQRRPSPRCAATTLPCLVGPVDQLDHVLLAALRHQRFLRHDERVVAHAEHDARCARTCPGAARRRGCRAARARAASGRWRRPAGRSPGPARRSCGPAARRASTIDRLAALHLGQEALGQAEVDEDRVAGPRC